MEGGEQTRRRAAMRRLWEKMTWRGETRLRGQDWKGGSPEAIGNRSLDLPPMNIHLGENPFGGDEEVGAIR